MVTKYRLNCFFGDPTGGPLDINSPIAASYIFKTIYDVCNALTASGTTTRIAYNTGSNGSGDGYAGESNQFGNNAWACWSFNQTDDRDFDFYFLVQFASASGNFGDSPGNPALINGVVDPIATSNGVVAIAMAAMVNSASVSVNPWNGTTNNDGNDNKGDPVWTKANSTDRLYVLPRSNNFDGSHSGSKENMAKIFDSTVGSVEFGVNIVASEDGIVVGYYNGVSSDAWGTQYWGTYKPLNNFSGSIPCPIVMWAEDIESVNGITTTTQIGSITGDNSGFEGGIAAIDGTYNLKIDLLDNNMFNTTPPGYQPSKFGGPTPLLLAPVPVGVEDDNKGYKSFLGYITSNLIRYTTNRGSGTVSVDGEFCACNQSATNTGDVFTIKWNPSATMPFGARTKEGEDF